MGDQKFEKRKICKQINKLQGLKSKGDYLFSYGYPYYLEYFTLLIDEQITCKRFKGNKKQVETMR